MSGGAGRYRNTYLCSNECERIKILYKSGYIDKYAHKIVTEMHQMNSLNKTEI